MTSPARVPILQIRLIRPRALVDNLATPLTAAARAALDPATTYTRHIRTARRAGHVRLYLTATRRETLDADHTTP